MTNTTAFWMLSQLFVGTFISIIFSIISYNTNMLGKVIIYGIGIPYFASQSSLGLAFVLGSLIAYAIYYDKKINNVFLKFLLLILAVFMGGYPTYVIPDNYYSVFKYIHLEGKYQLIHIIGAFLLILVVFSSNLLKKIFSCKFLHFFGNISYAIYLWHIPVMMSIGCYTFAKLQMNTGLTYIKLSLITFVLCNIITYLIAYLYANSIEMSCGRFVNKLISKIVIYEDH